MATKKTTSKSKTTAKKPVAVKKQTAAKDVIKATTIKRNDGYMVVGLEETSSPGVYRKKVLHSFSGKTYVSEENAVRAIKRQGYEHVKAKRESHYSINVN